ncbi:hypothetical protein EGW08_005481 [Elysia chlorotica]|uniref:Uncharacterized protein n=1 Tax=Elysia chlorotica TaxID=188477 RepID=A0A3S0ZU57_ELYCH|nr:hypothetical protein EGW08_005481 [Elysia chlorotica]
MNGHNTSSGSSEIVFNVTKIDSNSAPFFSGREGQVACSVAQKVFIFGGVEQGLGDEPKELNDLIVFDLDTSKWSSIKAKGTIPPARSASSLVAVGTKLYLFGGLSHISGWFDDLFVYDTGMFLSFNVHIYMCFLILCPPLLEQLDIEESLIALGEKTKRSKNYIYSKIQFLYDDDEEFEDIPESKEQEGAEFGWFNDLFVLDTETLKWSQPMQMNLGVPTQRAAHGMCAIGRDLVIFGGRDIEDRQNDLHIFNVDSRKWQIDMKTEGLVPGARSFHTLTAFGNKAVLFGGRGRDNQHFDTFDVFDIEQKRWIPVKIEGDKPAGRGQHCAVPVGDSLFVFGGSGNFSPETMQCHKFFTDAFLVKAGENLHKDCILILSKFAAV